MAKHYEHLKLEELDATSSDMPRGIRVTKVLIPPTVRECEQFLSRALELPKVLLQNLMLTRAEANELTRGWYEDPDTRMILKENGQSEADSLLRNCTTEILAQTWKDMAAPH
jgi:hypothetical protein